MKRCKTTFGSEAAIIEQLAIQNGCGVVGVTFYLASRAIVLCRNVKNPLEWVCWYWTFEDRFSDGVYGDGPTVQGRYIERIDRQL